MSQLIQQINEHKIKLLLISAWLIILVFQSDFSSLLVEYSGFLLLGIAGAIFANSTGAGGGVVFVPFFNQLGLDNITIVATSFAIQCCGMSAGAITWWQHNKRVHSDDPQWTGLVSGLVTTVPCSIAGVLVAQFLLATLGESVSESLHVYFGLFSILLAVFIYMSIPLMTRQTIRTQFSVLDVICLTVIAFAGGIITAWLSVGVGELIAVYLILRGFNITFAIALAVILSAFSVWGGITYHITESQAIYWDIILFAGAGAVIGGMIAKHVVLFFSPARLKLFFATWILVMGIAGLPLWQ